MHNILLLHLIMAETLKLNEITGFVGGCSSVQRNWCQSVLSDQMQQLFYNKYNKLVQSKLYQISAVLWKNTPAIHVSTGDSICNVLKLRNYLHLYLNSIL